MPNISPPNFCTMRRATLLTAPSPSKAKLTPVRDGRPRRTKVIMGWSEATRAPRRRRGASSSLLRAPLQCNAILPAQLFRPASSRAQAAMLPSLTQSQTTSAANRAPATVAARAPTCLANRRARRRDSAWSRLRTSSMRYPSAYSAGARAVATFPAPTMVILNSLLILAQNSRRKKINRGEKVR